MWFWATEETSIYITVVLLRLFYSFVTIREVSQIESIPFWWQILATYGMNFMLSCRLRNFVNIVKITHKYQRQLSGPLARVLISNWHCKCRNNCWVLQNKAWKKHANTIRCYLFLVTKANVAWLYSKLLEFRIEMPSEIAGHIIIIQLSVIYLILVYVILVLKKHFYFTHQLINMWRNFFLISFIETNCIMQIISTSYISWTIFVFLKKSHSISS